MCLTQNCLASIEVMNFISIHTYIKGLISLYTIECTSVTLLSRTRFSSISNFSCMCKIHTLISFYFLTSSKAIGRHIRKIPRRNTVIHEEWSSHIWSRSFFNNYFFLIRLSFKWSQNQIRDSIRQNQKTYLES